MNEKDPTMTEPPVGTDRIAFEAWLRTDGGKRAVSQIGAAYSRTDKTRVADAIRSSLWWSYVHGWNGRSDEVSAMRDKLAEVGAIVKGQE